MYNPGFSACKDAPISVSIFKHGRSLNKVKILLGVNCKLYLIKSKPKVPSAFVSCTP